MSELDMPTDPSFAILLGVVCNTVITMAYFHVPYELYRWFRGVPPSGTGLRALARLFQFFLLLPGFHRIALMVDPHVYPRQWFPVLVVDAITAICCVIMSLILIQNRSLIRRAFHALLKHRVEWSDR